MKFVQDQKIAPHTGVMTEGKGGNELWEIKRRTKTYINSKTYCLLIPWYPPHSVPVTLSYKSKEPASRVSARPAVCP